MKKVGNQSFPVTCILKCSEMFASVRVKVPRSTRDDNVICVYIALSNSAAGGAILHISIGKYYLEYSRIKWNILECSIPENSGIFAKQIIRERDCNFIDYFHYLHTISTYVKQ